MTTVTSGIHQGPHHPPVGHHHEIRFFVDGEPHESDQREWTPNGIIRKFGEERSGDALSCAN